MQLKTFSARSMTAVLAQIKEEMGPDAVILDTQEEGGLISMTAARERATPEYRKSDAYRHIGSSRSAFENAFAQAFAESGPATEVSLGHSEEPVGTAAATAAARAAYRAAAGKAAKAEDAKAAAEEEFAQAKPLVDVSRFGFGTSPNGTAARSGKTESPANARPGNGSAKAAYAAEASGVGPHAFTSAAHGPPDPGGPVGPVGWTQWHDEWNSIKNHLLALMKPALKLESLPPRQRLAIDFLQREGVGDHAVLELYSRLRDTPAASILDPLSRMVAVQPWSEKDWPQKLHFVAGPFGSGKTSVTIRLALALRRKNPDIRICLVNADASRGNGRLLLRHYAELSDMAYKEAASTMELVSCLNTAEKEGFDRIIVDLPGLARDRYLKNLLADAGLGDGWTPARGGLQIPPAVHVCFSPHYGEEQLRGLLERYRTGHAGSLIWTKLDEAEHYGQIVNVALLTGLPVSALSYGAGLGNSLEPARETGLWKLIFKRELP